MAKAWVRSRRPLSAVLSGAVRGAGRAESPAVLRERSPAVLSRAPTVLSRAATHPGGPGAARSAALPGRAGARQGSGLAMLVRS